jgi:Helix-turn-helix
MNSTTISELYKRPSRDEIAARVRAALPGADTAAGPVQNFATHLSARMRALGWDQTILQERAGITPQVAARAINGTGVSLELAGQIAELTGLTLAVMTGPYVCRTCRAEPPAGFGCLECGAEGTRQ